MEPTAAGSDTTSQLLPDDVLANILGRLPPRSLAAARCVCADWRAGIDDRRLLRSDLLPLSLVGIFICYGDLWFPEFFSRPPMSTTSSAATSGKLSFLPPEYQYICDHCNSLLLVGFSVINPATQQWSPLPSLSDTFT
uniref:F-box domain-containing protein n=1 Tax=Oryza punctata TaxID=4537 RepID=A0A0E0KH42_ORYPU